jgi:hypothetical protein
MNLALNEDGSLPGEPLPFLDAIIWFLVTPVGIFLAVWLLVVASENLKRSRQNRTNQDVITRINE